jgi:hypothetical protein
VLSEKHHGRLGSIGFVKFEWSFGERNCLFDQESLILAVVDIQQSQCPTGWLQIHNENAENPPITSAEAVKILRS